MAEDKAAAAGGAAQGRAAGAGRWRVAAALALSAAVLVAHSLRFDFVTDDAFISFVYAKNLVEHGQLVFTLGERVEGYTNFLWTMLMAGGLWAGIAPEILSRVLGTACAVATMAVGAGLVRWLRGGAASLWDALPAAVLALVPGYACWASGGLETQLFALCVTFGLFLYLRGQDGAQGAEAARLLGASGLCFGLAVLTRPEGALFFGLLGIDLCARKAGALLRGGAARAAALGRARLFAEALFVLGFVVLCVPHVLWRHAYYGYWVPNTFYIKSSGGRGALGQGAYYLWAFCRDLKLFVFPVLWALGLVRPEPDAGARARYLSVGSVMLLWTGVFLLYVASVGGDFMGLYRFVLPIWPLWVVAGTLGLRRLVRPRPGAAAEAGRAQVLGAVTILLVLHAWNTARVDRHALGFIGADRGIDTPGYLRHYTADRAAIGKWLGRNVAPDDYQVVGGAGAQVYYAGIRALDSFGLADAYVAHHVPPVSSRPGHQKFAPLPYVLSRNPTILTYNVYRIGETPYQPGAAEAAMWRGYGFHYVSVQVPGLSQPWYSFLKRVDRRLGPLPPLGEQSP